MFRSTASKVLGALLVTAAVGGASVVALDDDAAVPQLPGAEPSASPAAQPSRAPVLPAVAEGVSPSGAGLAKALAPALRDARLGTRVVLAVVDVETGEPLLETTGASPVLPASTAKIVTAAAALTALEPDARLTTTVLSGPLPGDVVLRGGGDPTLAGPRAVPGQPRAARLSDLATKVRAALGATVVRRVLVDDTLFTGPRTGPGWRPVYVSDGDVAPVSALSVDGGRVVAGRDPRTPDPAAAAGAAFAALVQPGATVVRGVAPAGAAVLGEVRSATVPALVEDMLVRSDNDLAEALLRHVAIARGRPGSFAGGSAALPEVLAGLEVAPGALVLADGSGLSRSNRVQPAALARLLARAASGDLPRLAPLVSGLPVAGFDGTLSKRFRTGPSVPAAGQVRAKTGTLNGVSALAGLVRTRDGRLLAFDVTADGVPIGAGRAAEAALDAVATALAGCGCP